MAGPDQYKMLSGVIRIANSTDLPHSLRLNALARLLAEAFNCTSVTFYIADNEQHCLTRKVSTLLPDDFHECRIPVGKGVAGKCAASRKPVRGVGASLHPEEPYSGTQCLTFALPLTLADVLFGVLSLGFDSAVRLTEAETELLKDVALEAGGIIRCMRRSVEVEKKLEELSFLHRISNAMLSTIKLNKLIHLILSTLASGESPPFDRAMLFMTNDRTGILQGMLGVARSHAGAMVDPKSGGSGATASRWDITEEEMLHQRESEFSQLVKETRLPLDGRKNLISRAVIEKKLRHVANPAKDKPADHIFISRFGLSPYAAAPLVASGHAVGVIVVDNSLSGRPLTGDDLHLLQVFTNQASMAVENSMLYNRLEVTNIHLTDVRERLLQGEKLAAIGKMAAGIAHELKSPLVSVGGFAARLKKTLQPGSDQWQCADLITREVQHLEKMLTDILFFSKKTTICYGRCSINRIVEDALSVVAMTLQEKNISIETRLSSRMATFLGDCQQLRHVFINLFNNAGEAMAERGVLTIESFSSHLEGKRAVSVVVTDTGGGVPLEMLHNIFTPFFTTKGTGTGLGLSIAHRIVANHGGKIEVNNLPGSGAQFTVTLPVIK